ncbi:TPA: ATP-grasp domain-containing protein [Vibrio cholerae]
MKTIYILETNFAGNGCQVMQFARQQGYKVHFLTSNPDDYLDRLNPLPTDIADESTVIDCYSFKKLAEFFDKHKDDIAAILTFDDFHLEVCARLCERYNLHTPSSDAISKIRDKQVARELINNKHASVAVCSFSLGNAPETSPLDYPVVVKPADESGSVGVTVCYNDSDWKFAIQKLIELPANVRAYERTNKILVEEYIGGQEYSAELIWCTDTSDWQLIGITQKHVTTGTSRVEIGHTFPCMEDIICTKRVESEIKSWLCDIGLTSCVAHVEFKSYQDKLYLIEVNARVAGGNIAQLVHLCFDIDLIECSLNIALGKQKKIDLPSSASFGAIRFIVPEQAGSIVNIKIPEAESSICKINIRNKFPIHFGGDLSASYRLGYCISLDNTFKAAEDAALRFVEHCEVDYA